MKEAGNFMALAIVWLLDCAVVETLLINYVDGARRARESLARIEADIQAYEFVREDENVREVKGNDVVLYCDQNGMVGVPRICVERSMCANQRLLLDAGLKSGGAAYLLVDKRCPILVFTNRMEVVFEMTTNVFIVGCAHDDPRARICERWKGSWERLSYRGESVDLTSVGTLSYVDPYYWYRPYRLAVDFANGDLYEENPLRCEYWW